MEMTMVITIIGIVVANLGTMFLLYFHTDRKLDENRKDTNSILQAISQEMKDFHGRLISIEERIKK